MKKSAMKPADNTIKNPDNWKTGNEPITGAQASYLETLASEAQEEVDTDITKRKLPKRLMNCNTKPGVDWNKMTKSNACS
jgi:Protein of unknown function (DUF3072)